MHKTPDSVLAATLICLALIASLVALDLAPATAYTGQIITGLLGAFGAAMVRIFR